MNSKVLLFDHTGFSVFLSSPLFHLLCLLCAPVPDVSLVIILCILSLLSLHNICPLYVRVVTIYDTYAALYSLAVRSELSDAAVHVFEEGTKRVMKRVTISLMHLWRIVLTTLACVHVRY